MNSKTPNLFEFATSELSQDAFLCWLIKWSEPVYSNSNPKLHEFAVCFVRALLGFNEDFTINSVEVGRQWERIDVWALINKKHIIIIEDKIGTAEHSGQLDRYYKIAKDYYQDTEIEITPVYYKMIEQGKYSNIEKAGYKVFDRSQMLNILTSHIEAPNSEIHSDIIRDYFRHLCDLDAKINSYKTLQLEQWHWFSWIGFYAELQKHIDATWEYVPNQSGGFLGFWWHWNSHTHNNNKFDFYLQLEQSSFVFKQYCHNPDMRLEQRDFYRKYLYAKAKDHQIPIHQFGRIGQWMGVARLNSDYRKVDNNGLLDFNLTIETLLKMQHLVDETSKIMKAQIDQYHQ